MSGGQRGGEGRGRELADGVPFTSYVWNNCSCLLVVLILHTLHVCVSCLCPVCRPEVNANFYGQSCSPLQCLSGEVPPPFAANCLYEALYDSVDFLVERHLLRPEERVSGGGKEAQPQSISVSGAGWRERERESGEQEMEAEPAVLGRGVESAKKKNKKKKGHPAASASTDASGGARSSSRSSSSSSSEERTSTFSKRVSEGR